MPWTEPKTWSTGEILTAADLNTYLRDNQSWMKARPSAAFIGDGSGDYKVTSRTPTKVHTDFDLTIDTTASCKVLVMFTGVFINSTTGVAEVTFYLDGSPVTPTEIGLTRFQTSRDHIGIATLVDVSSAGSHTFSLYAWSNSGTTTLDNDEWVVPSMLVMEVG